MERLLYEIERAMIIAKDTRKEFEYSKDQGLWFWHDRDDANNIENWQGPFVKFVDCLFDSVDPYINFKE